MPIEAVPCPDCGGFPDEDEELTGCSTCGGDGWIEVGEDDDDYDW